MNFEMYAKAVNKEKYENAKAVDCPKVYCENEYRTYNVKKEIRY